MRQTDKILAFCKAHGSITQRDAFKLGIYRLAPRIINLRNAGYVIGVESMTVVNRDGSKSRVAKYTILRHKEDVVNA